ncbi:MAG: hypothetical protein WC360_01575 [Opitutales bacterium]|jgi:hypothetical protein
MIRRLLDTRKQRERILLSAVLGAVLLLWAIMLLRSARLQAASLDEAMMDVRAQKGVIERKDEINARLETARAAIDPARTLGAIQLSSTVDALARKASLSADIGSPLRRESGIFNTNSVRVSVRNASLEQLLGFIQTVREQAPYLALRRFKMNADQRDPRALNAEIEIESFELNQSISQ